ncbi:MarR family winged helix-turn-helix transcriptional regulator [Methanobacterium lacus]|uniref:MarR family winged helix-turn-helix transcriptional regulator n=1 Tax=Methanobacterium lacus (strain AL-21) TaxID=877455 RepID=UPI00064EE748
MILVESEGPENYVCFKLNRVRRKIHRYYEEKLAQFKITPAQFYVLSALWDKDEIKFKDLAKRLDMDGATLTGVLDRMEKRDFIQRTEDTQDRRSVLVCLTSKSKDIRPQMIEIAKDLDAEFRKNVVEEDYNKLLAVLDQL